MSTMKTEIVPGITLYENAIPNASELLTRLDAEIAWTQESITFRDGKTVPMPRKTAWYGDPNAVYGYSGIKNVPMAWTPSLDALRHALEQEYACSLNSVLANRYADARSSIGWHADDERELRDTIVSVSLGAERTFLMRRGWNGEPFATTLRHGSVLTMTVASQKIWQHSVPKEPTTGLRVNLTFRNVASPG